MPEVNIMPKTNKGYQSLFQYMSDNRQNNADPKPYFSQQLLGALQPIVDIDKDFVDTFKPYKTGYFGYHAVRDFLQPLRGIGNTLKGVATILITPLVFLYDTIEYAFTSKSFSDFANNMNSNFCRSASWMLEGVSNLPRGVTQIIATPLTWFIKIPLRALITGIVGTPKIEENQGIQDLVKKCEYDILKSNNVDWSCVRELHRKFKKSHRRGQKTNIPIIKESRLAKRISREDIAQVRAIQYVGLFSFSEITDAEKPPLFKHRQRSNSAPINPSL